MAEDCLLSRPIADADTSMQDAHTVTARLFDLLGREETQCDLLEATIREEREAVRRLAIERFPAINDARTTILQTLQALEEERAVLMGRLAEVWQVDQPSITLSFVSARLQPHQAQGLDRRHERLAAKIRRLRHEIALNAMMVGEFQRFLFRGIQVWQDTCGEDGQYSPWGHSRRTDPILVRQRG